MRKHLRRYNVEIRRTGISFATYEVQATNEKSAKSKALDKAYNDTFSEKSSEYDVIGILDRDEHFRKRLEEASKIVAKWPAWKKSLLGSSMVGNLTIEKERKKR